MTDKSNTLAYYNEFDKKSAAWLRELIKQGHIASGIVDERSITDVKPEDLQGFTQCHFFAGIGGWAYAFRLAGVPDDFPCWTGSPPCQPFSVAGKRLGQSDDRHLAPVFLNLVSQCRPSVIFGEQVAAAIGKHWLDDLFNELERQGYTCGAAVLPACSVGAPHKRDRIFFGATALAYSTSTRHMRGKKTEIETRKEQPFKSRELPERFSGHSLSDLSNSTELGFKTVAHTNSKRPQGEWGDSDTQGREGSYVRQAGLCYRARTDSSSEDQGFWSGADWIGCRDGKFRQVMPGTFPMANGISARVGRLRGYGNAIVPQVAAEFVKSFFEACDETKNLP